MAKTIKFNLLCDKKPVRTIEDLQNNFSIEDVLDYYNNQLLHRWLHVRGYEKELEEVSSIISTESMDIIKELIRIFDVEIDAKKVEESIYMLKHIEERKELCEIYAQEEYNAKHIIDDYAVGYDQLVRDILLNPTDVAKIKSNIAEIVDKYAWVLKLNHRDLFYTLRDKSALAIMCLLMNEASRRYYLPIEEKSEDGTAYLDIDRDSDKKWMFDSVCELIKESTFKDELGENLISFAGVTDGYWKDLEPKGRQYMIISMGDGDFVRSSGKSGGDLSSGDIKNSFIIVDGVDYKSNSASREILYMEV